MYALVSIHTYTHTVIYSAPRERTIFSSKGVKSEIDIEKRLTN